MRSSQHTPNHSPPPPGKPSVPMTWAQHDRSLKYLKCTWAVNAEFHHFSAAPFCSNSQRCPKILLPHTELCFQDHTLATKAFFQHCSACSALPFVYRIPFLLALNNLCKVLCGILSMKGITSSTFPCYLARHAHGWLPCFIASARTVQGTSTSKLRPLCSTLSIPEKPPKELRMVTNIKFGSHTNK